MMLVAASIGLINEISISTLQLLTSGLPVHQSGLNRHTPIVVLAHPIPFMLLAMSLFYLWTYIVMARGRANEPALASAKPRGVTAG